jgi:hypothetical protein
MVLLSSVFPKSRWFEEILKLTLGPRHKDSVNNHKKSSSSKILYTLKILQPKGRTQKGAVFVPGPASIRFPHSEISLMENAIEIEKK